jgi:hypothetical protein
MVIRRGTYFGIPIFKCRNRIENADYVYLHGYWWSAEGGSCYVHSIRLQEIVLFQQLESSQVPPERFQQIGRAIAQLLRVEFKG